MGAPSQRHQWPRDKRRIDRQGIQETDGGGPDSLRGGSPARIRRADAGGGERAQASDQPNQCPSNSRDESRAAGAPDPSKSAAPVELASVTGASLCTSAQPRSSPSCAGVPRINRSSCDTSTEVAVTHQPKVCKPSSRRPLGTCQPNLHTFWCSRRESNPEPWD